MVTRSILDNKNYTFFLSESNWLIFKTPLKTDRIRDKIRGVKLTPASRRRYIIGLPVEGLKEYRKKQCAREVY